MISLILSGLITQTNPTGFAERKNVGGVPERELATRFLNYDPGLGVLYIRDGEIVRQRFK